MGNLVHNIAGKFMTDLNLALVDLEQSHSVYGKPEEFFFVVGAPRSGTTLLTQMLAYCYDMGYITNIAARFYMAPVIGCKVSEHILGDPHECIQFWSRYANTMNPGDIHEFCWFWRNLFLMDDPGAIPDGLSTVSFNATRRHLLSLSEHFRKPIVMKGVYPAYVRSQIDVMLHSNTVWVNIERDPLDCCCSIERAMHNKGVDWFGWYPPQRIYDRLKDLSLRERIAGQVAYFRSFYQEISDFTISYHDLTKSPLDTLSLVNVGEMLRSLPVTALYYSDYPEKERAEWEGIYDRAEADFSYAPT